MKKTLDELVITIRFRSWTLKIEDDTDQVGGQGEVNSLRVGRNVDVEEEQDEEDQVEIEVEALQTTIMIQKIIILNVEVQQ